VELGNADTELNTSRESHLRHRDMGQPTAEPLYDYPHKRNRNADAAPAGPKIGATLLLHGFINERSSTPIIEGIDDEAPSIWLIGKGSSTEIYFFYVVRSSGNFRRLI
jgi:hypothetical protein